MTYIICLTFVNLSYPRDRHKLDSVISTKRPFYEKAVLIDLQKKQGQNIESVQHEVGRTDIVPELNETSLHRFPILN